MGGSSEVGIIKPAGASRGGAPVLPQCTWEACCRPQLRQCWTKACFRFRILPTPARNSARREFWCGILLVHRHPPSSAGREVRPRMLFPPMQRSRAAPSRHPKSQCAAVLLCTAEERQAFPRRAGSTLRDGTGTHRTDFATPVDFTPW